jgi:hypothetical protein
MPAYDGEAPCTECGLPWPVADKRSLLRYRLLWLALTATVVASIYLIVLAYQHNSLVRSLPDSLLVRVAPAYLCMEENRTRWGASFQAEITRRAEDDTISSVALSKYAQRLVDRLIASDGLVHSRSSWPVDTPVRVAMAKSCHFAPLGPVVIQLKASDGSVLQEMSTGNITGLRYTDPTVAVVEDMIDNQLIHMDIEIARAGLTRHVLVSRSVKVPMQFVASWQDVLHPADEKLSNYLSIRREINDWYGSGTQTMHTSISLYRYDWQPPPFAIGLRIEVIAGERVLAHTEYLYQPPGSESGAVEIIPLAYPAINRRTPRQIRITPDPEVALRDFQATSYWQSDPILIPIPRD